MTESSNTCDTHGSADKRNCMGYAINELYVGSLSADGPFNDYVTHFPSRNQTVTWPSSVDPWHAATDWTNRAATRSDSISSLPVALRADFLPWCRLRCSMPRLKMQRTRLPICTNATIRSPGSRWEKRPTGSTCFPRTTARCTCNSLPRSTGLFPEAKLGGPPFEGTFGTLRSGRRERESLLARTVRRLSESARPPERLHVLLVRALSLSGPADILLGRLVSRAGVRQPHRASLERQWLAAEYSVLHDRGQYRRRRPPSTVKGGLWLADYVGTMMTDGAGATYYFHYMPYPGHDGNSGILWIDENYKVTGYPPQYFATQVITKEWVQPIDAPHKQFKVASDVNDAAGNLLVTAYAVERPDGQWSVMLVNRDQFNDHAVKVVFNWRKRRGRIFAGPVDRITFGSAEYQWHRKGNADMQTPTVRRRGRG